MAKIIHTEDNLLRFDDGTEITCDHVQDCCEYNYAKFDDIDDICRNAQFDTKRLRFEKVEGSGFRFGNRFRMFFVPCYSEQNGYYTAELDVYCNGKQVLHIEEVEESYC